MFHLEVLLVSSTEITESMATTLTETKRDWRLERASKTSTRATVAAQRVSALVDLVVKLNLVLASAMVAAMEDMVPQLVVVTEVTNVLDVPLAPRSQLSAAANNVVDSAIKFVEASLINIATMLVSQKAKVASLATVVVTEMLVAASIRTDNTTPTKARTSPIRTTVITMLSATSTRT